MGRDKFIATLEDWPLSLIFESVVLNKWKISEKHNTLNMV